MILDRTDVEVPAFAEGTGWTLEPQGACRGDICVPMPSEVRTEDGRVAVEVAAERLGMPLLHDEAHDLWSLGPASLTGRALETARAPHLELPDREGNPFTLSSLLGRKVVLTAWASW